MLLFPEYLLAIGTANLFAARENQKALQELADKDGVPWSRTHTIQADIGGIAIRFPTDDSQDQSPHGSILHGSLHGPRPSLTRSHKSGSKPASLHDDGKVARQNNTDDVISPQTIFEHTREEHELQEIEGTTSKNPLKYISSDSVVALNPTETPTPRRLAEFLRHFQENQRQYLQNLGKTPWRSLQRHVDIAMDYVTPAGKDFVTKANHVAPFTGNIWIVDSKQLFMARNHGIISRMPCIRREEIQDKNKTDGLMRLLAVLEVLWLITQLIVRLIQGLSSSALEFSTMAFSACAIIIYIIEWRKPKDVALPIYFDTAAIVTPEAFKAIVEAAPTMFMRNRLYSMPQSCVHQVIEGRFRPQHIDWLIVLVSIMSTSLFGGIHLIAWNIEFPTPIERTLWRTTALLVTMIPSICAICVLFESVLFGTTHRASKWSSVSFSPFYFASRLFLIVESFRALYFLPPDALTSTWVTYVPHIR